MSDQHFKSKIKQYVENLGCEVSPEDVQKEKESTLLEKMKELKTLESREEQIQLLKEEIEVIKKDLNI